MAVARGFMLLVQVLFKHHTWIYIYELCCYYCTVLYLALWGPTLACSKEDEAEMSSSLIAPDSMPRGPMQVAENESDDILLMGVNASALALLQPHSSLPHTVHYIIQYIGQTHIYRGSMKKRPKMGSLQ